MSTKQDVKLTVPDSACRFGKCDGQNACQKVGQCRYKHHEGGKTGQLNYSNKRQKQVA